MKPVNVLYVEQQLAAARKAIKKNDFHKMVEAFHNINGTFRMKLTKDARLMSQHGRSAQLAIKRALSEYMLNNLVPPTLT